MISLLQNVAAYRKAVAENKRAHAQGWPLAELEAGHLVEEARAKMFSALDQADLPTPPVRPTRKVVTPLAELTRRAVEDAISICNGDRKTAANLLGVGRTTLYHWLHQWKAPSGAALKQGSDE